MSIIVAYGHGVCHFDVSFDFFTTKLDTVLKTAKLCLFCRQSWLSRPLVVSYLFSSYIKVKWDSGIYYCFKMFAILK